MELSYGVAISNVTIGVKLSYIGAHDGTRFSHLLPMEPSTCLVLWDVSRSDVSRVMTHDPCDVLGRNSKS